MDSIGVRNDERVKGDVRVVRIPRFGSVRSTAVLPLDSDRGRVVVVVALRRRGGTWR